MAHSLELFVSVLEKNIDNRGKTPPLSPTGYPLIEVKHIQEDRIYPVFEDTKYVDQETWDTWFRAHLEPGDILFSTVGSIARSCMVPEKPKFCIAQNVLGFRVNRAKADPRFLYYAINDSFFQHEVHGRTIETVQKSIKVQDLKTCRIPLPPLAEQKAIAAVLGALDDKIELNRRMNATLEAMARALFQSWFVDFDPVRAKLDGRKPIGLDETTAALFPSTFDETAVGHIPHAWRVGSIYEISNVIYGAPFASSLFNAEKLGKPLIRIRDLPNESPAVFTTEVHTKGYLLQPGDIAVGMDGEFRAYLWAGVESWLNQRCCVFAPKPGFSAAFVRNSIIAPLAQVEATETATTVIHLGKNDIDRFTVIIPDAPVAEAFRRKCQPWYDQIVANKKQSRTLATLRDTLLPKLLSGELAIQQPETELP